MENSIIQSEEIKVAPVVVDLVKWNAFSIEAEQTADFITITDDEENGMAINTLSKIKQFGKEVESARTETVKPLNDLVKRVNNMYKPITESLTKSESVIKGKMLSFANEKERIRREEEAKRQREFEEAKRKAEQERIEAQKKADAEAKKNKTVPVIVEQTFIEPPKPLMEEKSVRSSEGMTTIQKSWKGEVSNPMDILKAIIEGRISISVVEFKQSELNNFAKAKKVDGVFDGIAVREHQTVVAR
jgi:hypothetical protein